MKSELEAIANAFDELINYVSHENGMKLRAAIADAMAKHAPTERRIVQIAGNSQVWALCNDGGVWVCHNRDWSRLPPIPKDKPNAVQS